MTDPITLEIVRGSLASTIREMELLMERCAMSPFIKEKKDYFVGIYDTRGRIVACHISSSGPGMLAPILRTYPLETMRPGDVYWFNDPYLTDGQREALLAVYRSYVAESRHTIKRGRPGAAKTKAAPPTGATEPAPVPPAPAPDGPST